MCSSKFSLREMIYKKLYNIVHILETPADSLLHYKWDSFVYEMSSACLLQQRHDTKLWTIYKNKHIEKLLALPARM